MPPANPLAGRVSGFESPARRQFTITPQDGQDLSTRPRVLRVLTDGDLSIRDEAGTIITYPVTAGETFGFSAVGIEATGTTATVVGWF
ncbi:hypothetical protein RA19_00120 [Leisingera sp. ANG-M1]|uniref:spike base protein, RCAP_Rcc01079 family n=1 Tax=Leisingera sp. ANG-M1 TaxID=1577895 RepID=UPI0005807B2E|nr:hypothetical protein [Leisingera sp. ANG-M1]KIC12852.1 hypothetical protein RA19_00120 [Leisingera sp. ANG-M1]